jgi:hypothetical membrane protein
MAWWVVVAAGAAPVLLIGGALVAASRQPPGYSSVRDTISALAAKGATDRWLMTAALIGVGASYMVTAAGLAPAPSAARGVLAGGGVATVLVALFPQPAHGNSVAHTIAAALAFTALIAWPLLAARRHGDIALMRPVPSVAAGLVMLGLVLWFVAEIHGGQRGLAERAAAGSESLWPLAVALSALGSERRER